MICRSIPGSGPPIWRSSKGVVGSR
jgi:hypothetical protein